MKHVEECTRIPDMLHYHNQNLYTNNKAEQEEQAVRKRAEELQEEVKNYTQPEDGQTAFEGCATDQIQTAMVELLTIEGTKGEKGDHSWTRDPCGGNLPVFMLNKVFLPG